MVMDMMTLFFDNMVATNYLFTQNLFIATADTLEIAFGNFLASLTPLQFQLRPHTTFTLS